MVPWNSTPGGFAYIWQSKWVVTIAIKTERTQIHLLSDVLIPVASLDLKVPSIERSCPLAWWESVPKGSWARAWKLSSRLFSPSSDCPWASEDGGIHKPGKISLWDLESWALESGIESKESEILLTIGIRIPISHWQVSLRCEWTQFRRLCLNLQGRW